MTGSGGVGKALMAIATAIARAPMVSHLLFNNGPLFLIWIIGFALLSSWCFFYMRKKPIPGLDRILE